MNILPLVSSFLLIFAILASSFVKDLSSTKKEEENYLAYMKASKEIIAKEQEDLYKHRRRKINKVPQQTSPDPKALQTSAPHKTRNTAKPFQWRREKKRYLAVENSKFNLHALIEMKKNNTDIKESHEYIAAANLVKLMYENAPFFKKMTEENPQNYILDKLLESGIKDSSYKRLFDLFPRHKKDHEFFYKIFQGTKRYQLERKQGYPPLYHFFTIDKQQSGIISFSFASKLVLEAYFGKEILAKVREKEETKWRSRQDKPLTKEEFMPILQDFYSSPIAEQLLKSVLFGEKKQISRFTRFEFKNEKEENNAVLIELPKEGPFEDKELLHSEAKTKTSSEPAKAVE